MMDKLKRNIQNKKVEQNLFDIQLKRDFCLFFGWQINKMHDENDI